MDFNGIEVNAEHHAMLLQLENRLGKVEYIIDGEPTSGFEGVSKSGDDSLLFIYRAKHRGCPGMQDCPSLLYALQMKEATPMRPADAGVVWQQLLADSINRLILELKATDEAKAMGFDHSYIFKNAIKRSRLLPTCTVANPDSFKAGGLRSTWPWP